MTLSASTTVADEQVVPAVRRRDRPGVPRLLGERIRPLVLSRDELLVVAPPFAELLGTPGIRRGSTLAVVSAGVGGATSVALGLVARASATGSWCAAVGMESLGCVAASEFGLALDRMVLVPRPGRRASTVVAALLDGCDVVLVASALSAPDRRRLSARARERRSVLVQLVGAASATSHSNEDRPEGVDVCLSVTKSAFTGLGQGVGRVRGHRVDVVATRRSASPREVSATIWFAPPSEGKESLEISAETTTDEPELKVSMQ